MSSNQYNIRQHHSLKSISYLVAAILVALSLSIVPVNAYASVLNTDLILDETVEKRGDSADTPDISAPSAIMIDSDGTTVFERNADAQLPIASTTKIMTAYLALLNCSDSLDSPVTISSASASMIGSVSGLATGDVITLHDLLLCAMLPSGNDAADAIARYVGQQIDPSSSDPYSVFINAMNDETVKLGMLNTVYRNPHGLDIDQYAGDQHSTARDLSVLIKAAMQNDTFRDIVSQQTATVNVTHSNGKQGTLTLKNTDTLLGSYDGAIGIKTGTTQAAGYCFAGAMNDGTKEIYTVLLNDASHDVVMADTKALFEWAKKHDENYNVAKGYNGINVTLPDGTTQTLPVMATVSCAAWINKTVDAVLADWSPISTYNILGDVSQSVAFDTIQGGVKAGDKIGTVTYTQGDTVIATRDLIAAEDVPEPNDIEKICIAISRVSRTIHGEPLCAQSAIIKASDDADDSAFSGIEDDAEISTRTNTNKYPSTTVTITETSN